MSENKTIDGVEYAVVDSTPVELDPPDPALVRWRELTHRYHGIDHFGDVEKVIKLPRPAWAPPNNDFIGTSPANSYYRSNWVHVASRRSRGRDLDGETLVPASVCVRTKIDGDGIPTIGVATRKYADNDPLPDIAEISLYPSEAADLINALRAAVDLIGGP